MGLTTQWIPYLCAGGPQASADPIQLAARVHHQDCAARTAPHHDPQREHEAVPAPGREHLLATSHLLLFVKNV